MNIKEETTNRINQTLLVCWCVGQSIYDVLGI